MSLECAVFIIGVIIQVTAFTSWVQVALGRLVRASVLVDSVSQSLLFVSGPVYGSILFLIWLTYSAKPKPLHLRFGES